MNSIVVKLMADYSAITPLWGDWEDLALPTQLVEQLEAWQEDFEQCFHYERGWDTAQHRDRWQRDAQGLIDTLRQVIGDRADLEVNLWPLRPECEMPGVVGNLVGPDVVDQVRAAARAYCESIGASDNCVPLHELADHLGKVNPPSPEALASLPCTTDSYRIWLDIPVYPSHDSSHDSATKAVVGLLEFELARLGTHRVGVRVVGSHLARSVEDDEKRLNRLGAFVIDVNAVTRSLLPLLLDGVASNSAAAFAVLDADLARKRPIWNPGKADYLRVAESLPSPRGTTSYLHTLHPGLAAYLRDALIAFAHAKLP